MNKKIAILRGINVGGKRKILMADLKTLCEKLGWQSVSTYIQSGNVIFKSNEEDSVLEENLAQAIQKNYGFEVPVIVRDAKAFNQIPTNNPFLTADSDINQLHVTFLKTVPTPEKLEAIQNIQFEGESYQIIGKEVYIQCKGKYHESKLSNAFFEKKLGVSGTTRNWRSVFALCSFP